MEGNLSSGNMNSGGNTYGSLDMQSPPHHRQHHPSALNQHHQSIFQPIQENFPLTMVNCEKSMSLSDFSKGEKGRSSVSEEEETSFTEDMNNEGNKGKKGVQWHRVKWTDKMVKLLITAVSYIGEDNENGNNVRRRCANSQKKGKWKSISKVMSERGHSVSPQQCEDKFNDLNKRYKRLNEILGRGISCQVVEKPELLDMMHKLSEKAKDEVKKILSSKQLFYEEMCSYHNKNRLHLPHDPELQRSLRVALRIREDHDHDDLIEDDHDAEVEDQEEFEENNAKKMKPSLGHGDFSLGNSGFDTNLNFQTQIVLADMSPSFSEGVKDSVMEKQWIEQRALQLEEQRLKIQEQKLELEREKFKWQRFCRKEDRELEMMKVENEKMKHENERMAMELKKMEMGIDIN